MMDFLSLARMRYSCRSYQSRKVEPGHLNQVLEAGRIAPSACNYQPWHFLVMEDKENLKKICKCYGRSWLETAPLLIVVCGDHSRSWKRDDGKDHCDVDIAIAVDHMTLAASSLGLATCWICRFDAKACAQILGLPPNIEPVVLLPLGYPNDATDPARHASLRMPLEKTVHYENW